jgi:hypothetical protein
MQLLEGRSKMGDGKWGSNLPNLLNNNNNKYNK